MSTFRQQKLTGGFGRKQGKEQQKNVSHNAILELLVKNYLIHSTPD